MLEFFVEFICLVCLDFIAVVFQFKINFRFSNCERWMAFKLWISFIFREIWREVFGWDMNTNPILKIYWNEKCRNWNEMAASAWNQNANALMFANKLWLDHISQNKNFCCCAAFCRILFCRFDCLNACVCVCVCVICMCQSVFFSFSIFSSFISSPFMSPSCLAIPAAAALFVVVDLVEKKRGDLFVLI